MNAGDYAAEQWRLLVQVLERLQAGRVGITEACRDVVRLRRTLGQESNELFLPFVAVESETDRFPLGPVRADWSSSAIEREDEERLACEGFYAQTIASAVERLLTHARSHAL